MIRSIFDNSLSLQEKLDYWQFDVLFIYAIYKINVRFVQVGSNNGVTLDPIHNYIKKFGWEGVLVEPVPYLFEELKVNYKNFSNVLFFENSAIAKESGKVKFYRLKKSNLPNLPFWYEQLGSFKKDIVMKHRDNIPCFDDLLIEDSVNAITFCELIKKYAIQDLDFIHIDAEGYDYEIIKLIPFADLNIDLLMFEHKHLSYSDYKKARKLLRKNGYEVRFRNTADTIAIKTQLFSILTSVKEGTYALK